MERAELSAETVNIVEDWVTRLEAAARSLGDSADTMKRAAQETQRAATDITRAANHFPTSVRVRY